MTVTNIIAEAADNRTLLGVGAESSEATPPPTRLDEGWDEYAAAYLAEHPEISAAVPAWTEEVDFSNIASEDEGTVFSFSRYIGNVELYGVGKLLANGAVHLEDGGAASVYLPAEIESRKIGDVPQWMLDLSRDLIAAACLLRSEPKLLRRPADVDDELRRLDI